MSEQPYEPLSPADIEHKLRWLDNQLGKSAKELARLRDAEVEAKQALGKARRKLLLSGDCPKVTRGGYTTAERDAWVDDKVEALLAAFEIAEAKRESAQDHLRTLRDQSEVVRSLGTFVKLAYEMAGVAG